MQITADPGLKALPSFELRIAQLVRSAAYAAECPIAVFYPGGAGGFQAGCCFGIEGRVVAASASRVLAATVQPGRNGLLVVNDIKFEPGLVAQDIHLFGDEAPAMRFVAAAQVADGQGVMRGILMVADVSPHAGLGVAKTYVLRAHAAQLAALLELQELREASGLNGHASIRQSRLERLRLLESVVVNASDAVLITQAAPIDLPGPRIVYCNAAFTRTTGYAEAEIIGLTPRLLQSSRTDHRALARLRLALSRWEPVEVELLNCRKDGSEFWVELSIAPVANELGWFTHWVSVQRDLSDRKLPDGTAIQPA